MTDEELIALLLSIYERCRFYKPTSSALHTENTFPALYIREMQICCVHKIGRLVISSALYTRDMKTR